jgi:hypothetical protein
MDRSRREFFKRGLTVVAAVSVAELATHRIAFAADMAHVDAASAQATSLGARSVRCTKVPRALNGAVAAFLPGRP